jgi:hypothetical protein
MFTNRYFSLIVAAALIIVIVFAVQQVSAIRASVYSESSSQAVREYHLGERYGVTPHQYTQAQIQREYWLGERYGQTP